MNDGWIAFSLTHDEKPVVNAKVRVLDTRNGVFAEGEPEPEGRGKFPMPLSRYFLVEAKVGERFADPILLTKGGNSVAPDTVLLSFGLRPCCRTITTRAGTYTPERNSTPGSSWWPLVTGAVGLFCLTTAVVLGFRLSSPIRHQSAKIAER